MTDSQQDPQEDLVDLLCSNLTAPIDDKRYFGSQQSRMVDQESNSTNEINGYLGALNYPYYPPGTRDGEWQEYVALMKFPGVEPPQHQHQQDNGHRDAAEGGYGTNPSEEAVYGHTSASEADFVQSFAVHGQSPNFMEYPQAGYLPGLQGFPHQFNINPQLYSHITDSRLFAPVYSFQYPIALHPNPEMHQGLHQGLGYYPPENYQQELLDGPQHPSQPLMQHAPVYPQGHSQIVANGAGHDESAPFNEPLATRGGHHQQLYAATSGLAALSLQEQQQPAPQGKTTKPKSEGRSWADVLTAPTKPSAASTHQSQSQPQPHSQSQPKSTAQTPSQAQFGGQQAGQPKPKAAAGKSSPLPPAQASMAVANGAAQSNRPKPALPDDKQPRRAEKPKDTKLGPEKVPSTNDVVNPRDFDTSPRSARFFVIKSYSEDDVHKAIKYNIWASTDSGNRRLDAAFRESSSQGPIYLLYSVNASGQFCGMAQMMSPIDYAKKCDLWAQDKWNGQFAVKWIFIKDIPNNQFRHIRLENNDNKPVTNSRDTQEVMLEQGKEILRIFLTYTSKTSILDDFGFYDKRQELMKEKKTTEATTPKPATAAPTTAAPSPSPSPAPPTLSAAATPSNTGKPKFHRGPKPSNHNK